VVTCYRQGFEVIGFADDLVITVRKNDDPILSERMQGWCKQSETQAKLEEPSGEWGLKIEFSKDTKYLGVVLDSKLLWNSHAKRVK
jgi:hypothetical protein